jgi:sigma-B regulation protein RsbU (phosphoserine phosphatase)
VTVFYAVYDPGDRSLTWANAGHCPPVLVRRPCTCIRLDSLTPPAGVLPAIRPAQRTMTLHPGDRLLAFSDGITESRNMADEEFGEDRLRQVAGELERRSASEVCQLILDEVREFAFGVPQADDLTVIAAHVATSLTES